MQAAATSFQVFVLESQKCSNHSVGKIWKSPTLETASLVDSKEQHPHPKLVYFFSKQLALCMIVALRGEIFILDWILYWHIKWINILVSVWEYIKFHYSINKMKEAVNLVQSPRGGKIKSLWNCTLKIFSGSRVLSSSSSSSLTIFFFYK